MRTIAIIGTDWSGPDPKWVRQPFLDNGRLGFDRMRLEDWQNVFYELGDVARLDALAVGIRGAGDTGAVASLPIARQAHEHSNPLIPLTFWADTVGLPDIAHAADCGCGNGECRNAPFDFDNPQHIEWDGNAMPESSSTTSATVPWNARRTGRS